MADDQQARSRLSLDLRIGLLGIMVGAIVAIVATWWTLRAQDAQASQGRAEERRAAAYREVIDAHDGVRPLVLSYDLDHLSVATNEDPYSVSILEQGAREIRERGEAFERALAWLDVVGSAPMRAAASSCSDIWAEADKHRESLAIAMGGGLVEAPPMVTIPVVTTTIVKGNRDLVPPLDELLDTMRRFDSCWETVVDRARTEMGE